MMKNPSAEPKILYGDAFTRHLTSIYNLRITHKNEEILLFCDDVSGAFRWPRLHPFIASSFCFPFFGTMYIPTGQVFGSNTSAKFFEPLATARSILAQHLFNSYPVLVEKHTPLINQITFSPAPVTTTTFTQANPCLLNKGVKLEDGSLKAPPFVMFVDDLLHG